MHSMEKVKFLSLCLEQYSESNDLKWLEKDLEETK